MSSPFSSSSSSSSSSVAFSLSSRALRSERASPSCEALVAFVPFSWEEKPGVPKQQNNPSTEIIASHHHPKAAHCPQTQAADYHFPLRKPPCLEKPLNGDHAGDRAASSAPIKHHSCRTLRRKQSNKNLRVEDDPFVMAIQACRKGYYEAPIRVFYENNESHELPAGRCSHEFESRSFTIEAGTVQLKHLTIRQLFTQHLQEEEELKNQKEPLILTTHSKHRKKSTTPFSILASCLGYNKSYNSTRR